MPSSSSITDNHRHRKKKIQIKIHAVRMSVTIIALSLILHTFFVDKQTFSNYFFFSVIFTVALEISEYESHLEGHYYMTMPDCQFNFQRQSITCDSDCGDWMKTGLFCASESAESTFQSFQIRIKPSNTSQNDGIFLKIINFFPIRRCACDAIAYNVLKVKSTNVAILKWNYIESNCSDSH